MNKLFLLPLMLLAVGVFFVRMGASATSLSAQRESLTQAIWLIAENFQRESLLSEEQQAAKHRLAAREKVAEELIAGRIGLLEAAAHFRELNRLLPQGGRNVLCFLPGD